MIDLGTLGGLLAHRHELAAYCPRCDSWRVLPLAELVAADPGAMSDTRRAGAASGPYADADVDERDGWLAQ